MSLDGTTWIINSDADMFTAVTGYTGNGPLGTHHIVWSFVSDGQTYTSMEQHLGKTADYLTYGSSAIVWYTDTKWVDEKYRTIEITSVIRDDNGDGEAWLNANAVQVIDTVDYLTTDTELTSIADAIRTKGGTSASLVYPTGFVSAIQAISTGTDVSDTTAVEGDVLAGKYFYKANGSKVQGTIATKTSSNMTVSGATVTAPAGYYASDTSKSVASGTAGTPSASKGTVSNHSISVTPSVTNTTGYITGGTKTGTAVSVSASELVSGTLTISSSGTEDVTNYASVSVAEGSASTPSTTITSKPSISVNSTTGLITATNSKTQSVTPTVSEGFVTEGTAGTITVDGSNTSQLSTVSGSTITPTEAEQTAVASGKYTLGAIKVGAISSTYIGSDIDRNDSDDMTVSGATVTAPAGYYASDSSKAVASGTAGTPTATKGTVSNHAISVTPSVTNTTGYITGGTKTGTAVSVSASELVSGTLTISSSGTKDVTNYASASVASGSATTPATTITAAPSISVNSSGLITATNSKTQSITPSVSAGYVSSGTAGTITVSGSNTSQLTTQAAQTITPGTTNQTIASGKYLTGAQTILGDADLVAENIKKDVEIFGVTGTYEGTILPDATGEYFGTAS